MKSIRTNLMLSYIAVMLVAVSVLEVFLMIAVRAYYYDNINQALTKQAQYASSFYGRFLSGQSLEEASKELFNNISQGTGAEVQIIDRGGRIIYDSIQSSGLKNTGSPDVKKALEGYPGYYEGRADKTDEEVMAVVYPLRQDDEVIGAVRLISSLKNAGDTVGRITLILILFGVLALAAAWLTGLILSRAITGPIKDMTKAASSMAEGRFETKVEVKNRSEIGQLGDALNYMAGEVVRHERLKDEFIASISHDLRTPLTSIKGWAVILRSGGINDRDEVSEGLDIIEKESDRLTGLVEELLDFSRLESGRMKLNISPVRPDGIISYVKKQMEGRALRQGVNLFSECEADLEIKGDDSRLKQALINIADNSLKFTSSGGSVRLYCRTAGRYAVIGVDDNGVGISEEDLPKVTQKFYKGDASKGSGLGLSISSQIASLHGGELKIESTPGKGTRVEMLIPL